MRAGERSDLLVIVIKARRAAGELLRASGVTVQRGEIAQLASGLIGSERVTVVKIAPAGIFDPQLPSVTGAKALGVTAGTNVRVPAHHAHFLVIPAEGIDVR